MGNCEIDPNAPLTPVERLCVGALLLFAGLLLFACFTNAWGK